MESRILLVLLGLCAMLGVSTAISCYKCQRLEVLDIAYGDDATNKDKCEYPVDKKSPTEADCEKCFMDVKDGTGYEWVERGCIKTGTDCTDGDRDGQWPDTDWIKNIPGFDSPTLKVKRTCCTTDNCNKDDYNPDSASSLALSASLVFATIAAIFYNY